MFRLAGLSSMVDFRAETELPEVEETRVVERIFDNSLLQEIQKESAHDEIRNGNYETRNL